MPPFIMTYNIVQNKKMMSKILPKLGKISYEMSSYTKLMKFKSIDVTKQNVCILPIFDNIYIEYKCKGDFNKYLKEIEIIEYPHKYKNKVGRISKFIRKILGKKKELPETNDGLFRAVFHFHEKPTNGSMDVEFI